MKSLQSSAEFFQVFLRGPGNVIHDKYQIWIASNKLPQAEVFAYLAIVSSCKTNPAHCNRGGGVHHMAVPALHGERHQGCGGDNWPGSTASRSCWKEEDILKGIAVSGSEGLTEWWQWLLQIRLSIITGLLFLMVSIAIVKYVVSCLFSSTFSLFSPCVCYVRITTPKDDACLDHGLAEDVLNMKITTIDEEKNQCLSHGLVWQPWSTPPIFIRTKGYVMP